jgi:hypothetical protein
MRRTRLVAIVVLALCIFIRPVAGQEHQHQETTTAAWSWTFDGNAFLGRNYQQRLFADYTTWESQN